MHIRLSHWACVHDKKKQKKERSTGLHNGMHCHSCICYQFAVSVEEKMLFFIVCLLTQSHFVLT